MIRVVAGPEFAPAADVLRIQGVAVGLAFLAAGPSYGLLSLRHHRAVLVGNLAALAVSAALVPILASADGARGAAVATVVAEVVLTVVMIGGAARAGLPIGLTARGLTRVLFAAGAALAAALAAPLPAVGQTAIAGVVYLAVLAALRGIPEEVLELLPGRRGAERT